MPVRSVAEQRRRGLALVTSLVLLLVLALLAAALLETYTVHVRMAAGNLAHVAARQAALAQLEEGRPGIGPGGHLAGLSRADRSRRCGR